MSAQRWRGRHSAIMVMLLMAGVLSTGVRASDANGSDESSSEQLDPGGAVPSDEAEMGPVQEPRVPEDAEASGEDAESRPHVETILEKRKNRDVSPADADYPLVPGCEPVAGETRQLPPSDWGHHLGSRGLCLPAQWMDTFFAKPQADFYAARTLIRIVGASQWQEDTDHLTDARVDASVALPHAENRLSLIFRSDDQDDDRLEGRDRILQEKSSRDDDQDDDPEAGVFRTALRWAAYQTRRATGQLEVGVRGSNPFVPFVRAPYRYRQPLPWRLQARVNQEFYWRDNEDRRGLASELELERPLTTNTLVRVTASAESNTAMREANRDWRWSQSVRWFWRIKKRAALQTGIRVNGNSEPVLRAEARRFSIRLRHSFWRPWFYVELEPYVFQKRNDSFRSVHGLTLRLETQLGDYR